jgi:hypothetical protein
VARAVAVCCLLEQSHRIAIGVGAAGPRRTHQPMGRRRAVLTFCGCHVAKRCALSRLVRVLCDWYLSNSSSCLIVHQRVQPHAARATRRSSAYAGGNAISRLPQSLQPRVALSAAPPPAPKAPGMQSSCPPTNSSVGNPQAATTCSPNKADSTQDYSTANIGYPDSRGGHPADGSGCCRVSRAAPPPLQAPHCQGAKRLLIQASVRPRLGRRTPGRPPLPLLLRRLLLPLLLLLLVLLAPPPPPLTLRLPRLRMPPLPVAKRPPLRGTAAAATAAAPRAAGRPRPAPGAQRPAPPPPPTRPPPWHRAPPCARESPSGWRRLAASEEDTSMKRLPLLQAVHVSTDRLRSVSRQAPAVCQTPVVSGAASAHNSRHTQQQAVPGRGCPPSTAMASCQRRT